MPSDSPTRRRQIARISEAHLSARGHLAEMAKLEAARRSVAPAAQEPARDAFDGIDEETSDVIAQKVLDGMARQQQATLPDSDPPAALSMGMEGGRHMRVRSGWLAALVVVVIGACVAVWLIR